ncbi:hypothetical protein HanRHA438_Chr09g0378911 [Helianthus annuus]|nr:hypothetical protein HanRHA438_Chr09g0378911 [Helianthus annuus]
MVERWNILQIYLLITLLLDQEPIFHLRLSHLTPLLSQCVHIFKKGSSLFLEIRSRLVLVVVSCSCIFTVYNGLYCFVLVLE